jgi:hypothetical protein
MYKVCKKNRISEDPRVVKARQSIKEACKNAPADYLTEKSRAYVKLKEAYNTILEEEVKEQIKQKEQAQGNRSPRQHGMQLMSSQGG